jgi:hypothetical protein
MSSERIEAARDALRGASATGPDANLLAVLRILVDEVLAIREEIDEAVATNRVRRPDDCVVSRSLLLDLLHAVYLIGYSETIEDAPAETRVRIGDALDGAADVLGLDPAERWWL